MRFLYSDLHRQPSYKCNNETPPNLSENIQSNFSSNQCLFQTLEERFSSSFDVILKLIEFLKKYRTEEGRFTFWGKLRLIF